jgi:hypothetical protein
MAGSDLTSVGGERSVCAAGGGRHLPSQPGAKIRYMVDGPN